MFIITKKSMRNADSIPFYDMPATAGIYFREKFILTGKFIKMDRQLSDNKLILTTITSWKSHQDFLDFMADEFCQENVIDPNNRYDIDNNIETEYSVTEEW